MTILTTYTKEFLPLTACIVFAVLSVICFVFSYLVYEHFEAELQGALLAIIASGLLVVSIVGFCALPNRDKIYYKVILDETVNMEEFVEQYEIIEQDGKIFTIVEKAGVE